ncbi:phosphatidylserine decarboxylase 1 [Xanthoria parietina]
MATSRLRSSLLTRLSRPAVSKRTSRSPYPCVICQPSPLPRPRPFLSRSYTESSRPDNGPFRTRLRSALRKTKVEWRPIPITLGIGFLGAVQLYRVRRREQANEDDHEQEDRSQQSHKPAKRKRIRPSGPWQVQVMSTLPLKAVSRLWGRFNELEIPYYLRTPGFRLYSWIFGVNLAEASESDLHVYPNLASFFYRTLKPGVRPLDPNPSALLSPADGRVLQMGMIENGEVEQVKGMTYSLDALLGKEPPMADPTPTGPEEEPGDHVAQSVKVGNEDIIKADEEFANVNGISYTLPNLFSGPRGGEGPATMDASTTPKSSSEAEVRAEFALGDGSQRSWWSPIAKKVPTALFYVVVYLAPGDYHRFHSPTSWVAEKRRHFAGELYSVSPYLQRTLPGLFTLNERVVLLGRWRWGFFSFTPVGATNVGSIKINFDSELRTNSLTTDTAADRAAEAAADRGEPYSGFAEATYAEASELLGGHALRRGEEMGGFQLGSSIVLVFEAPKGSRKSLDDGWADGERKGGWRWGVRQGQRVKYGEAMGWVDEEGK